MKVQIDPVCPPAKVPAPDVHLTLTFRQALKLRIILGNVGEQGEEPLGWTHLQSCLVEAMPRSSATITQASSKLREIILETEGAGGNWFDCPKVDSIVQTIMDEGGVE